MSVRLRRRSIQGPGARIQPPTRPVGTEFSARQNNLPHCLDLVAEQTCRPPIHDTEQDRTERNGCFAGLGGQAAGRRTDRSSRHLTWEQSRESGPSRARTPQPAGSHHVASHRICSFQDVGDERARPTRSNREKIAYKRPPSRHNGLRRRQPGRCGRTRATPPPNARGAGRPADLLRCGRADVPCDGHFVWRDREAMP